MMKYNTGKLRLLPPGEVSSHNVLGNTVRLESQHVDGNTFYRYILNPGLNTEYVTFWSSDAQLLFRGVLSRIKGPRRR